MRIEETIELPYSPERIWPWLAEPERMPRWVEDVTSGRTRDGEPIRAGSLVELVPKGRGATIVAEVVRCEKERELALRVQGGLPDGLVVEIAWNLAQSGTSTTLGLRAEAELTGLMIFMESLIANQARKKLRAYAERLSAVIAED